MPLRTVCRVRIHDVAAEVPGEASSKEPSRRVRYDQASRYFVPGYDRIVPPGHFRDRIESTPGPLFGVAQSSPPWLSTVERLIESRLRWPRLHSMVAWLGEFSYKDRAIVR